MQGQTRFGASDRNPALTTTPPQLRIVRVAPIANRRVIVTVRGSWGGGVAVMTHVRSNGSHIAPYVPRRSRRLSTGTRVLAERRCAVWPHASRPGPICRSTRVGVPYMLQPNHHTII